jgi:hypothetical protein
MKAVCSGEDALINLVLRIAAMVTLAEVSDAAYCQTKYCVCQD